MAALPPQPAAPLNLPVAVLAVPLAPAAAVPTGAEAAAIRLYVDTLAHLRIVAPTLVTLVEFANWSTYSDAINSAAGGIGAAVAAAVGPAVAAAVGPAVAAAIAPLTASIANIRITNRNNRRIEQVDGIAEPAARTAAINALALEPLRKETAGAGIPVGGAPVSAAVAALLPAAHPLPVGTPMSSPPFPATLQALRALTANQIIALSVAYNDQFGMAAGDPLAAKRRQVEDWIKGV